jgi:hypothetical protein
MEDVRPVQLQSGRRPVSGRVTSVDPTLDSVARIACAEQVEGGEDRLFRVIEEVIRRTPSGTAGGGAKITKREGRRKRYGGIAKRNSLGKVSSVESEKGRLAESLARGTSPANFNCGVLTPSFSL